MPEETSHSQIKISWLFGIAIAFILFVGIGKYSARMTQDYSDYDQERAAQRYDNLKKLQADEKKQINPVNAQGQPTAIWIDQDKGIISIPIDEAMAKEITDLKAKTPGPGNEINPPAPAPAPAPAAAPSTNAAPASPAAPAGKPGDKPAPPAKPAPPSASPSKQVKTTSLCPAEPAFETHPITTTIWTHEGENCWVKGTLVPADQAQPSTTTILTPGIVNQPVFNTRKVKTVPGAAAQQFQGYITYGGVSIPVDNNAVPRVPAHSTN